MAQVAVLRSQNRANNKGSDPRLATCRGKLQSRRSKINSAINKEFRMRTGAENLFRATNNKKLKSTVALELSFVNSNLQLLREKLISLNGNLDIYQGKSTKPVMPMIPLGLKETKSVDFRETFKDFILEHYSEDADKYEKTISEFMQLREAIKTPTRDENGVNLFMQYYIQLISVEKRFFPSKRVPNIFFEWYDSFVGVPSCQRSIDLEKASILFNMGALHTQIGAKQDRSNNKGLDQSVDSYLRAAGTFGYIRGNFVNSPSADLNPQMMTTLIKLMLAQARECLFLKLELQSENNRAIGASLDLAQESAHLSGSYGDLLRHIKTADVKKLIPCLWLALINLKCQHYSAIAHYHAAVGMLSKPLYQLNHNTIRFMHMIHVQPITENFVIPITDQQRVQYGNAHAKSALIIHEQAQRILRICRELKNIKNLIAVISQARELTVNVCSKVEEDDEFGELFDTPEILSSTKIHLRLTELEFDHLDVRDLFHDLGPINIFSAEHFWTAPRIIQLQKIPTPQNGFGIIVKGEFPAIISNIERGSSAYYANIKIGDFIVAINDLDVKWAEHRNVVKMIRNAGNRITLKLITPMDKHYLKTEIKSQCDGSITSDGGISDVSGNSSNVGDRSRISPSNCSSAGHRLSWNLLFKKRKNK